MPRQESALGTKITLYSSENGKLRFEDLTNYSEKCLLKQLGWVADFNKKTMTSIIDSKGKKLKVTNTFETCKKTGFEIGDATKVKYLSETKVILGYTCHKATYNGVGTTETNEIWYTTELGAYISPIRPNLIKGTVLQYTEGPMIFTAKKIVKQKISDTYFNLDQRQLISSEQFQKIINDCLGH